jgi:hypothetical protein
MAEHASAVPTTSRGTRSSLDSPTHSDIELAHTTTYREVL